MAYYHDRMFSLGEFESALKVVTGIVDGLPSAVVEELKTMRSRQLDSGHVGSR